MKANSPHARGELVAQSEKHSFLPLKTKQKNGKLFHDSRVIRAMRYLPSPRTLGRNWPKGPPGQKTTRKTLPKLPKTFVQSNRMAGPCLTLF